MRVSTASHGESIDVPLGAHHRLGNQGDEELVIVEVQLGGYTGEDDICRYEDDYGRPSDGLHPVSTGQCTCLGTGMVYGVPGGPHVVLEVV